MAPTIDQQNTVYTHAEFIQDNDDRVACAFVPTQNNVVQVDIHCGKQETPIGNVYVAIYDDDSGEPGSLLVEGSISLSGIGAYAWHSISLTQTSLTPSNTYYIVVRTTGCDSTNYLKLSYDRDDTYGEDHYTSPDGGTNWTTYPNYCGTFKEYYEPSVTISGVTYDKTGSILGSCNVFLCQDNGDNTAAFIAHTTSNAVTGAYSFQGNYATEDYFVIAWKDNTPHVFDCTDHVLQGS